MPLFTQPLALFGLLALPALAAIYLLRNRYRPQPVSSLLLWLDPREPRTGGPRIDRLQTPLLFFLELLLVTLLSLAAAGPYVRLGEGGRPLVVILDDSFSMLAGEPNPPRAAALADLDAELRRGGRSSIRFVLAGERPVLLGESVSTHREAMLLLEGWRCEAPASALADAVALAAEVGGEQAALLVVTDRPPDEGLVSDAGRLVWRSFGRRAGNLAFVTASRTTHDNGERCLLEIANLSDNPGQAELVIETGDPPTVLERKFIEIAPGGLHRLLFAVPADAGLLRASIGADLLAIDNQVSLLPPPARTVAVEVSLADPILRQRTERALRASRAARLGVSPPALLVTDELTAEPGNEAWVLRLSGGELEEAFDGPFIIDRTHPLADGLSLQGVVWAPGTRTELPGRPVLLAGNVALVTDSEDSAGRHLLRLRLRHDLSTLLESPSWPVLLDNLLRWRALALPGIDRSNIRLGEAVTLKTDRVGEDVTLIAPRGSPLRLNARDGTVSAHGEQVGLHAFRDGDALTQFSVNALNREESDLRGCASETRGDWLDETALNLEYQDIGWMLLLAALAVAALHLLLVARLKSRG